MEFNVVVRLHTIQFLKELKKYFNIFIVTWWQKELVTKILPLIDPDGTVFPLKNIISLKHNELKSIEYVLNSSVPNAWDFLIIDRCEFNWAANQ